MYVKEGNHFPGKQKSGSKTQNMFGNLQQSSKASHERTFLGEIYSENYAHLETFLKESNEDVIKMNQMMSYTKCRLSHCTLMYNKKRLVRSRIFAGIKMQPHVWEKRAAP